MQGLRKVLLLLLTEELDRPSCPIPSSRIMRSAMAPNARNPLNSNSGSTLFKPSPLGSPRPIVSITNVTTKAKES